MICKQFDEKQDVHTSLYSLVITTVTAFGYWIDLISVCFVTIVTYSFIFYDKNVTTEEKVGLAITQVLGLCDTLQYGMKLGGEIVSHMISVERLFQFTKLKPEESLDEGLIKKSFQLENWPSCGKISFERLYLCYDNSIEPVLKNLNLILEPGTKVHNFT